MYIYSPCPLPAPFFSSRPSLSAENTLAQAPSSLSLNRIRLSPFLSLPHSLTHKRSLHDCAYLGKLTYTHARVKIQPFDMSTSQCVCLVTLLWSLVEVHSQTSTPFISFMGRTLDNHSYVDFNQVGWAGDGSDSVRCHTELETCCSSAQGNLRGDWFFPNGSVLPFPGPTDDPIEGRGAQAADLRRFSALSPSGLYRCDISFDADDPSAMLTFYVGIYNNGGIYS